MKARIYNFIPLIASIALITSCGFDNIVPVHEHTFASAWSHNEEYHWHAATCEHTDVKGDYGPHTWGKWIIDQAATESSSGLRHHVCSVCAYSSNPESYEYEKGVPATRMYMAFDLKNNKLFVDSTETLKPVVFPNDAYKNVKFVCSDPTILSVTDDGIIKALKEGTSLITVYNDNNDNGQMDNGEPSVYTSYTVYNKDTEKSLVLDKYEVTVKAGEEVSINPSGNGFSIQYFGYDVADSTVATAYDKKIRGLKPGVTEVKITGTPSGALATYQAKCKINVVVNSDSSGIRAYGVKFKDEVKVLNIGETYTPTYEILPSDAVDTISSITSNNDVVTITNGVVTASKAGTAILTIKTSNNKIDRMKVVVNSNTTYDSNYNNYYGNLTWTDGEDLKAKLHTIISTGKRSLKYSGNWTTNQDADSLIGDSTKVNVLYSDDPMGKTETASGWQREHCLAASIMTGITTGEATNTVGRATDFHNLYAAKASGNTSRGNKNFGYADRDSLRYGSKEGTNTCYDLLNFEPDDSDKGTVARAIFYMGVMYNSEESMKITGGTYNAQAIELMEDYIYYNTISYSDFTDTSKPQCDMLRQHYVDIVRGLNSTVTDATELNRLAYSYMKTTNNPSSIGNLSTLLMWNSYTVSKQEMQHNNSVYSFNSTGGGGIQGNRNPFVDYPELAEYIYGAKKDQAGSLSQLRPAILDTGGETPEKPDVDPDEITFDNSKYSFTTGSNPQNLVKNGVATFGELSWDFEMKTEVSLGSSHGLKIGSSGDGADTLTLTTKTSLEDVDAVFLKIYCAANQTYHYDIFVGEEKVVDNQDLTGASENLYTNLLSTKKSGKVKIVFSGLESYMSLKGIAINYK